MPSDPVPLVIHIAHINDAAPQNARSEVYEREFVDRALTAKDETIAALREKSVVKEGLLQLALQAVQEHEAELSAVRQQLADAQQTIKELKG